MAMRNAVAVAHRIGAVSMNGGFRVPQACPRVFPTHSVVSALPAPATLPFWYSDSAPPPFCFSESFSGLFCVPRYTPSVGCNCSTCISPDSLTRNHPSSLMVTGTFLASTGCFHAYPSLRCPCRYLCHHSAGGRHRALSAFSIICRPPLRSHSISCGYTCAKHQSPGRISDCVSFPSVYIPQSARVSCRHRVYESFSHGQACQRSSLITTRVGGTCHQPSDPMNFTVLGCTRRDLESASVSPVIFDVDATEESSSYPSSQNALHLKRPKDHARCTSGRSCSPSASLTQLISISCASFLPHIPAPSVCISFSPILTVSRRVANQREHSCRLCQNAASCSEVNLRCRSAEDKRTEEFVTGLDLLTLNGSALPSTLQILRRYHARPTSRSGHPNWRKDVLENVRDVCGPHVRSSPMEMTFSQDCACDVAAQKQPTRLALLRRSVTVRVDNIVASASYTTQEEEAAKPRGHGTIPINLHNQLPYLFYLSGIAGIGVLIFPLLYLRPRKKGMRIDRRK